MEKPSILSHHSLLGNVLVRAWAATSLFSQPTAAEETVVHLAKAEMQQAATRRQVFSGISVWWVTLEILTEISVISIKRLKNKQNQDQNSQYLHLRLLDECEANTSTQTSLELSEEYQELRRLVNDIEQGKGKRAVMYSGARLIEEGVGLTRYFLI